MAPDPHNMFSGNRLLRALGEEDRQSFSSLLTPVDLPRRMELELPNRAIEHAYFLDSGIASVVAHGSHKKQLEVGLIGREGVTGLMIVLGDNRSPHSTYIQIAGEGQRIAANDLRRAMAENPGIRTAFLHFTQAFLIQATHTALSNGTAKLEERLARWLLMAHDRTDGDALPLIHEFLALMLGVRRSGVTVAIHSLEGRGLIRATRGNIVVLDRGGLEDAANASYGVPEAEYRRLLGEIA